MITCPPWYLDEGREAYDVILSQLGPLVTWHHCLATAYYYRLRNGAKDGDVAGDAAKAEWWEEKARNIDFNCSFNPGPHTAAFQAEVARCMGPSMAAAFNVKK